MMSVKKSSKKYICMNFQKPFSYYIFKFRKQQMFADATSFSSKTQFMYFDGGKNKALGEHLFSFPPSPIFIIIFYMKYKKSSTQQYRKNKKIFLKNVYISVRRRVAGNFQLFFVVCVKYRMFRQAKYKQFVSPRLSSPSTIDFQKC